MDTGFKKKEMKDSLTLKESLERKVIAFYTDIWMDQRNSDYQKWLDNFEDEDEKLNALYLLSKFTYFGGIEIRALLKALYRDVPLRLDFFLWQIPTRAIACIYDIKLPT